MSCCRSVSPSIRSDATRQAVPWATELGPLGAIWMAFAATDLALGCLVSQSAVWADPLDWGARLGTVCANAAILAAAIILVGVPWLRMARRRGAAASAGRPFWWQAASLLGLFVLVLMYLASWAVFRDTGQFLDGNCLKMIQATGGGMLQHALHMRPLQTLLGPLLALVAATVVAVVLPRWGRLRRFVKHPLPATVFLSLMTVAAVGAFWGELLPGRSATMCIDGGTGIPYREAELYASYRDDRSGPLTHGLAELRRRYYQRRSPGPLSLPVLETSAAADRIPVDCRPRVSMDDYLAAIDEDGIRRHHVIVLIVESLRPDQLCSFGGSREVMPHLDALARESRIFTHAYTQASHSNYADLCPLSSHYPLRESGIHAYPRSPTYPRVLIYDVLKRLGYQTALVSSQNEHWGQMLNYLDTGNLDHILHAANYAGPTYTAAGDTGFLNWVQGGKKSGKIDDRITVTEAVRWIRGRHGQPFFMYLNLQNSHIPYVTPPDFPRRFAPQPPDFTIGFNNYPPRKAHLVKDMYADSLAYVDLQIGRLIDGLQRAGQWDRTILVVTGDTGQAFYEHGFAAHANKLYDEVMRVPLIVHAPGLAPRRDNRPCQHIDVPPSVFALLGLPPHPSFQGCDIVTSDSLPDRSLYLTAQAPLATQVALVRRQFKLIFDSPTRRFHLYDLRQDPGERRDVADDYPGVTGAMAARLRQWCAAQLEYYGDPKRQRRSYPPVLADSCRVD